MLFNTVKATLGFDRIKFMGTGSAPISDECLIALRVIFGVPVIQGLGLSETGGGICCSYMRDQSTVGHCGGVICCSEARVGEAGGVERSWCRCRRWATRWRTRCTGARWARTAR